MVLASLFAVSLAVAPAGGWNDAMAEQQTDAALREFGYQGKVLVTPDGLSVLDVTRTPGSATRAVSIEEVVAIVWTRHPQHFAQLTVRPAAGREQIFPRDELRRNLGPRPPGLPRFPLDASDEGESLGWELTIPATVVAGAFGLLAIALTIAVLSVGLAAAGDPEVRRARARS
jgi:hypothetical protein